MAKNLTNIRSYGDEESGVWVAPIGTDLPEAFTALAAGFVELGWVDENGTPAEHTTESQEFKAWQGAKVVKKKRTSSGYKITVAALEENAVVLGLVHRGQTPVVTGGVTRYNRKNMTKSDDRAVVVDYFDGTQRKRDVFASADVSLTGTIEHKNDALTIYTFEITEQGDGGYTLYGEVTP